LRLCGSPLTGVQQARDPLRTPSEICALRVETNVADRHQGICTAQLGATSACMTSAFLPCFQPHRMPSLLGPLATQRRQSARFLASDRRVEPPNDGPPPALSSSPHHSGMSTVRFTLQRLTHSTSRPPTLCRVDDSTHALSRMTTAFTPSNAIALQYPRTAAATRPFSSFEPPHGLLAVATAHCHQLSAPPSSFVRVPLHASHHTTFQASHATRLFSTPCTRPRSRTPLRHVPRMVC
jgi:hypothetical protein